MIAPHHEDDEDAVVDLPLLVEIVAGNTPQVMADPEETENTTMLSTTSLASIATTDSLPVTPIIEPPTTSTTTKKPFLLPISG